MGEGDSGGGMQGLMAAPAGPSPVCGDGHPPLVIAAEGVLLDTAFAVTFAWRRAFHARFLDTPGYVIHRELGGRGVPGALALAGPDKAPAVRDAADRELARLLPEVVPIPGAVDAVGVLAAHACELIVAVDADARLREYLLRDFRDILLAVGPAGTRSAFANAIALVDDPDTLVVAAAPWQLRLARLAELNSVGVRTGGYADAALLASGASWVAEDIGELARALASGDTAAGAWPDAGNHDGVGQQRTDWEVA